MVRNNWLGSFVVGAAEPGIGLVGECLSPSWDAPGKSWRSACQEERLREHLIAGLPGQRVPCYLDFFRRQGIPPRGVR